MSRKKFEEELFSPEDWVNVTAAQAVQMGASDIHVEPGIEDVRLRFRIDGVLHEIGRMPREHMEPIVARLKVLGQLDSAEHRVPQEGHALVELPSAETTKIDMRISLFPTVNGEAVVIRILGRGDSVFTQFTELGMAQDHVEQMEQLLKMPFGMVLATGPTGSGKTTLLYTALSQLISPERNIVTLEDPVERQFSDIRQSQINPAVGLSFATGLRSILRQDPDVIMIGEIRDAETAEIAARASLTGRLLFSTLHTKDTFGAITRLLDFDIPRSIIASSLRLVITNRLIRRICDVCVQPAAPAAYLLEEAGKVTDTANTRFVMGKGCESCGTTGYRGRVGVFEILRLDQELEQSIIDSVPIADMRSHAVTRGMRTLRTDAVQKAAAGLIALEDAVYMTAM